MLACHARAATVVCAAVLMSSSACTQPEEEFDAFQQRYETQYPPVVIEGCPGDPCMAPAVAETMGDHLFTLSAALGPDQPVLFDTQLAYDGMALTFTMQPLLAMDRMTKTGMPVMLGPYTVAPDGCFAADFPELSVPGEANPISGTVIVADIAITGRICAGYMSFCGDVTGNLIMPFMFDLAGSTYTCEKLAMPGAYPEPPTINCAGDLATPL
jgi:hypothetical protein